MSEGGTAVLTCGVYAPRDSHNNLTATVKWYRSESVVEDISDKYENSMMLATIAVNSSNSPINGLFRHNYKLIIRSINSSDSGVYWCHLSADRFCLMPSAYVNITVNISLNGNSCLNVNYQRSPVCALNNPSSCQVTPTPPFLVNNSTPTVMANIALTSLISPVAIPRIPTSSPTNSSVLVGSLSFIVALLAVALLITIVIFALAWMRRDKKNQCETCRSKLAGIRH